MATAPSIRRAFSALQLRVKFWFEIDGHFVVGEGGIPLLEAIDRAGSLAAAARHVGWSYRHAWGYLRRAEQQLGVALTVRRPGKGRNRGLDLTAAGRRLIRQASTARAAIAKAALR